MKNAINCGDDPKGSEGGYTESGEFIPPDAMMEIVQLRTTVDRMQLQIEAANRTIEDARGSLQGIREIATGEVKRRIEWLEQQLYDYDSGEDE